MNRSIFIFGILSIFMGCKSTHVPNRSDFSLKNDSINLYAFIGKKISVKEFHIESTEEIEIDTITGDTIRYINVVMDQRFNAKYSVLKNIFNELPSDTIDFIAFDHYGQPPFKKHRYVMLYISLDRKRGIYYHQKYQFDPLRKVKKNNWRGLNGESIEELFNAKKNGVLKARGLFD